MIRIKKESRKDKNKKKTYSLAPSVPYVPSHFPIAAGGANPAPRREFVTLVTSKILVAALLLHGA